LGISSKRIIILLHVVYDCPGGRTAAIARHVSFAQIITVQHGSADTVVRAMNVKYRKWRLGGPITLKLFNRFP